ncbi:nucleotidyltransferase family protein [Noviherbaspirillum sp. ST9]|uniref:nucleotidyltransferase family protein n=1 Tax=Noviherbaspirillum sp. ST9 TaxID=3401606 RepID=UPI003B5889EC
MSDGLVGILLAAGRGARFDATGQRNKLLQPIASGEEVAVAAARNLIAALPSVLAVVRPGNDTLAARLSEAGCKVTVCEQSDEGMAASLVHALSCKRTAQGWVIALADMPYVRPATISALAAAIEKGAGIAAPVTAGRRGNPVAFANRHLDELLQLRGDEGARKLLNAHQVTAIAVDDPGILQDIDKPSDLHAWN